MASLRASLIGIVAAAVLGGACSLINQFDPVKQGQGGAGTGGHASTSSGAGGNGNGAGGGGASSMTSGGGGTSPTTGSGGGGGSGKPLGLIVATGNPSTGGARVFATLDPTDGHQLQRYTENVAVVLYDEVTDLWYLFIDDDNLPPQPGDTSTLQVGQIDPKTGTWVKSAELSPVPVLRDYQSFAVLNNRIVYKAYDPESEAGFGAPVGLAIIDTTDTSTLKLGGSRGFIQVPSFFGLIGTRANAVDGGTVNLISLEPCSAGTCQVERTRVSFPADASIDPGVNPSTDAAVIPPAPNMFSISAAWTSRVKDGATDILVYPPVSGNLGTIQPFNPASAQALTAMTWDASGSDQFYAVAIAECEDVALVTEQANQAIYAVSLTSGMATSASTSTAAQILAYEPINHTVVASLHIPNVPIVGYTLNVTGGQPALAQRNWSTPSSLNADNVTVRRLKQPTTQSCQSL